MKDAVRDGLRAINNAINDRAVVPGAGAVEVAASRALHAYKEQVKGKQRLGVQAYAEALLVIPKTLGKCELINILGYREIFQFFIIFRKHRGSYDFFVPAVNSGFDAQDSIVKLLEESTTLGEAVGLDVTTGEALKPADAGIYDNYVVKRQIINSW